MRLPANPRAVITGAGGGLGRAFALQLADRKAHLLLSDIDEAGLADTAQLATARGALVETMLCNVAEEAEVEALFAKSQSLHGYCDLLVNNAGVAVSGPVGEIPLKDWDWIIGINLRGVMLGCHFFLPAMKKRGSGHVLNVASIAGFASSPLMAPYNATKAAVIALSETLSGELEGSGVGCTVLCPYFFRTKIMESGKSYSMRGSANDFIHKIMTRTREQAEDVARLAIEGCERGAVYVFPHREAWAIQAIKRAIPAVLHKHVANRIAKRVG